MAKRKKAGQSYVVRLGEQLSLSHFEQMKSNLDDALAGEQSVCIDASGVEHVDTGSIQALGVFVKALVDSGRQYQWKLNDAFMEHVRLLGMQQVLQTGE